jgi:hypothetical protein
MWRKATPSGSQTVTSKGHVLPSFVTGYGAFGMGHSCGLGLYANQGNAFPRSKRPSEKPEAAAHEVSIRTHARTTTRGRRRPKSKSLNI